MRPSVPPLLLAALVLSSCVTWPTRDDEQLDPVQLHPRVLESPEMAASFLKNLKGRLGNTEHPSSIEIDRYSVRFSWQWVDSETRTSVNTYFGVAKASVTSKQHEQTVAIPLPQVQGFSVQHWPTRVFYRVKPAAYFRAGVDYRKLEPLWFFNVHLAGSPGVFIRVPDEGTAQQLADTLGTLARAVGAKVDGEELLMANIGELTPAQRERLGPAAAGGGVLVLGTMQGGAAGRNGLRFLDVITAVNGERTPDVATLRRAYSRQPVGATVTFLRPEAAGQGAEPGAERFVERTVKFER